MSLARRRVSSREEAMTPDAPSEGFYAKLCELLEDPLVRSAAYIGDGDQCMLRLFCAEQRRRGRRSGQRPEIAFPLHAMATIKVDASAWGGYIRYYAEGIGDTDLFVRDGRYGASLAKNGVERGFTYPAVILTHPSGHEIAGYRREDGDGWSCYRRLEEREIEWDLRVREKVALPPRRRPVNCRL